MENCALTGSVIGAAMEVHRHLGPGLLEAVYEDCLCDELSRAGIAFARQITQPLFYKGRSLGRSFRIDMIVERILIVEVKALIQILPVREAQLQSYLRLSGIRTGLLLTFNQATLREGIRRRTIQWP